MLVVANRLPVADDREGEFEELFEERAREVTGLTGLKRLELLRADSSGVYVTRAYWESREAFDQWRSSKAFQTVHAGLPAGMFTGSNELEIYELASDTLVRNATDEPATRNTTPFFENVEQESMTESDSVARARRAFDDHPAFEARSENEYVEVQTAFDTTVELSPAGDGKTVRYRVTVEVPMLDAIVENETVAPVVESGWFETLELRLDDAHTVTKTNDATPPTVIQEDDTVAVIVSFETERAEDGPVDGLAIGKYVEGTWLQGVIPGYEYGEPAKSLIERAEQDAENDSTA